MFDNIHINRLPLVFKSLEGKNYFQFHINGQLASLEYDLVKDHCLRLKFLEIGKYLNRSEVRNALIARVMEYSTRGGFKIITSNLEVLAFLEKHPEYEKLIATDVAPIMGQ